MGYLTKPSRTSYALTPVSEDWLVKTSDTYIGGIVQFNGMLWEPWGRLTEVVKTGKPASDLYGPGAPGPAKDLGKNYFPLTYILANQTIDKLNITDWKNVRVLEGASGHSHWGIAFARRSPDVRVTAVDQSDMLARAKNNISKFGLDAQFQQIVGDLPSTAIDAGAYDLVVFDHVCEVRGEDWTTQAIDKAYGALKSGGKLLLTDEVERSGDPTALFYAVDLLVNTAKGATFTFAQYEAWFKSAGFVKVDVLGDFGEDVLCAVKP
jgi:predicted O-methyltransferase YrrM